MEDLRIDAQRLIDRVRQADAAQVIAHHTARREDRIDACVQPADVALEPPLGQRTQTMTHELRKIRVIEGRDGYAPPLRDAPAAPRRMEGIADLDQIGLQ